MKRLLILVTLVPHTTSVQGTRFEVTVQARFLHGGGVFDAQQILTVPQAKLVRAASLSGANEMIRPQVRSRASA